MAKRPCVQFISGSSHITEIGPCVVSLQPNVPNQYFKPRFASNQNKLAANNNTSLTIGFVLTSNVITPLQSGFFY